MDALEARYRQGRLFPFAPAATIEIDAPPEKVWAVLTDFERYGEWNAFTPRVLARLEHGAHVVMRVQFPGGKPFQQVEVINAIDPPRRLAWGVVMGHRVLLVANRHQVLEPVEGGRTRYTSIDRVSGLLAPLVRTMFAEPMSAGFRVAAEGLKARCEA